MGFSKLEVSEFSNLVLEVHTVGYPVMGESIVTMLKDGDKVLYTIVTDCFKTADADVVKEILVSNGSPTIDVLVWTHPDEDHSVGIEELLDAFDKERKARVYKPINLSSDILNNDAAKAALDYLEENYNKNQKYKLIPIGSFEGMEPPNMSFEIKERTTGRVIFGSMHFLLPNSTLADRRNYTRARNSGEMNDFSVVYVLMINGVRYFYGADMTRASAKFLTGDNCYPLDNIRFIKIPHHGSNEPAELPGMLMCTGEKMAVATTTVYNSTNPTDGTLNKYAKICAYVSSTDRGDKPYGDIQLNFKVTDMSVPKAIYHGNAKQVRP